MTGDYKITGKLEVVDNLTTDNWTYFGGRTVYKGSADWTTENTGGALSFYPGYTWQGPVIRFYSNTDVAFPAKVSIGVCQSATTCGSEPGIGGAMLAVGGPLAVKGKITVLNTSATWPDYVFSPSYHLRPLTEVGRFVQANRHLPDVPSAAQVQADGAELTAMNATLLRKVEELTLYLLQLQTANQALTERVARLERTK